MEKVTVFYRMPTKDCPLAVSYYAPVFIAKEAYYPQVNEGLCITFVQRGHAEIYTKGRSYLLRSGDIFILPPRQLHTFRTATMDTRYIYMSVLPQFWDLPADHFFRRDFWAPLFSGQLQLPDLIQSDHPLHAPLTQSLSQLDAKKEGSPGYSAQLFSAVSNLCAGLMPYCTQLSQSATGRSSAETAVLTCLDYIKTHYREKVQLQELADHTHLHPNYLCAVFKEHTGRTVFEYLERYRIRKATQLLRGSGVSVAHVAESCGFGSVSFFSRKFRALVGMSPLQYRKHYAATQSESDFADI